MRKKNESGTLQIYKLPNHSWRSSDDIPPGSKYDKPEIVVRRIGRAILIREKTWSAWKEGQRYNFSKEFCGEHRPNETWKPIDLWRWGDSTIEILAQKAKDGSAEGAEELARLALKATASLNKILERKPELIQKFARGFRAWPVIKQKKADLSEDEKRLFGSIHLGANDYIENDPQTAKWRFDDAGRIAFSLLNYIRCARGDDAGASGFNYGGFGKFATKRLKKEFCDESALDWWKVAKEILLWSYPEPHAIDELKSLVPPDSRKRKSPGRFKQAILRKLESRFLSFARNTYR